MQAVRNENALHLLEHNGRLHRETQLHSSADWRSRSPRLVRAFGCRQRVSKVQKVIKYHSGNVEMCFLSKNGGKCGMVRLSKSRGEAKDSLFRCVLAPTEAVKTEEEKASEICTRRSPRSSDKGGLVLSSFVATLMSACSTTCFSPTTVMPKNYATKKKMKKK
jgi:hypothetical protein